MEIVLYPDKRLKQETVEVSFPLSEEDQNLISELTKILNDHQAVGVAAPQIGSNKRVFLLNAKLSQLGEDSKPIVFINPTITKTSKATHRQVEACLSFPGIVAHVERPVDVELQYQDAEGGIVSLACTNFPSRSIQHEMDHILGLTFIDRVGPTQREMLKKKMSNFNKKNKGGSNE